MVREDSQQAGAVNSNNSNNNNMSNNNNNNYNMFFAPIWGHLTTTGQIAPSNCCRLVVAAVVVVSVTQGAGKFGKLPLIRVKMSCLIPLPMGLQRNLRICGNCSNCSLQWNCAPVQVSRVLSLCVWVALTHWGTTHSNRVLIAFAQLFIGMRQLLCHENFAAVHTQHTAKSPGRTLIDFLAKLCKL